MLQTQVLVCIETLFLSWPAQRAACLSRALRLGRGGRTQAGLCSLYLGTTGSISIGYLGIFVPNAMPSTVLIFIATDPRRQMLPAAVPAPKVRDEGAGADRPCPRLHGQ